MKQILHKSFFAVLLILMSCVTAPSDVDESENLPSSDENYRQTITLLLETFDSILSTTELENELTILYRKIRPIFASGQILVVAEGEELRSSLERSKVSFDTENSRVIISLHASILDNAEQNPVSAMSEFAGKLGLVDAFLQHGSNIVEIFQDPLEFYLAQMDGIYLQTLFLRDFASSLYGDAHIDPYEDYLLQGLTVDNFNSLSLFVWGIDRNIIYSMLGLSTQLGNNEVNLVDYVHEVWELGLEIRDTMEQARRLFEESGTMEGADGEVARRNMYIASTSANTYRTLGSIIFSSALGVASSEEYDDLQEEIQEIDQIYNLLELLINEVDDFRKNYREQYLAGF